MTEAGHCYSFITALCSASDDSRVLRLWASRRADVAFGGAHIQIRKYFYRKIRRFQTYFLFRRLLKAPGKVFVSTARHIDLLLLDWAASGVVAPKKAYLYVHWFNPSQRKQASLKALARKQPNLEIYGPTPTVAKVFQDAGFANVHVVPYPISRLDVRAPQPFRYLLYAGAARTDKGFSAVVDLIGHLSRTGAQIPVVLQTSSEHEGKYDPVIRADLQRLNDIAYPHLRLLPDTLDANQYADLFAGAICLQLYDAAAFADRISGVTLDSFSSGAPVVTTAGSWIARMVQRFDAGAIVGGTSPEQVLAAVEQQIAGYSRYQVQARAAGDLLQQENSADTLFKLLAN